MEESMWNIVKKEYKSFKGKYPSHKSIPSKKNKFYTHSFSTTEKGIFSKEK